MVFERDGRVGGYAAVDESGEAIVLADPSTRLSPLEALVAWLTERGHHRVDTYAGDTPRIAWLVAQGFTEYSGWVARARGASASRSNASGASARGRQPEHRANLRRAFDLQALTAEPSSLAMVPVFLVAVLAARGLPAVLYLKAFGRRRAVIAALMQATSLPLIVAATAIGVEGGLMDTAEQAALIAAGLVSLLLFPAAALTLLRG